MARQIKFGDKLLLQGETLVLDNGASAGVIRSKNGTIQIEGNLIVTGDTTTVNSLQTSFADPKILLNGDLTGSPTEDVGIEIGRGSSDNKFLTWNETSDKWTVGSESFVAGTFEGNITGAHNGTVGATTPAAGSFTTVDIDAGTIDGTVIGSSSPAAGTFTTLTATTITGAVTGTVTGTVSNIANHSTTDLSEGTNLYYTQARVDTRYAQLQADANFIETLDGQTGSYYLDYTNFTGTPTTTSSLANHSIDALNDVDTTTVAPTTNQTIIWNGTNFVPGESFSQSDFNTAFTAKDTDDLSEGTTNLYHTDARTQAVSINNIVEDTTPQLGGNLDLNTFDLSTTDPTVKLTTTLTPTTTSGTVVSSSDTNLSNTTVTVNTDNPDVANAVSSYITLTSADITTLGFEGDISLTYFGAAAGSSNFVWRDIGDSAEQNNMVVVYAPPTAEYTFTLPTNVSLPTTTGDQTPFNSDDADIYFKQYAYGEMTVSSASTLSGSTIQLRDSNGFYIDKEHVTVASLGGSSYKIVFWTHDVSAGDVIDVIAASAQTAIFEWGTESFSEPGFILTSEGFSVTSSTNDIFALGDLEFTTGLITGEVVGTAVYDSPTGSSIISGLTTITIDGTGYQAATTTTDIPLIFTGNASGTNELSIAVGSATDARLWLLDNSGSLIYKFPAADGTANQVMKTDGAGDLAWANDIDTTYVNTDWNHDLLTGFVANEHIDWTTDQGATNIHAGNYTNTTYTGGTNVTINGSNVISSTDTIYTTFNTDFDTRLGTKSTTNLAEGTNLYYTNARADARAQLKVDALVGGASAAFDTLVEIQNAMATDTELTSAISGLNHDTLSGFVANEHIDWTSASAGTIDPTNYVNTGNTTYTAGTNVSISVGNVISADDTSKLPLSGGDLTGNTKHVDGVKAYFGTGADLSIYHDGADSYIKDAGIGNLKIHSNETEFNNVAGTIASAKFNSGGAVSLYYDGAIKFATTTTGIDVTGSIIPATDNTYDLGSTTKKYANIHGYTVTATYADLAERYATDVPYEAGTVVVFGGEAEITTTIEPGDVSVAGVISTNPALKLNADAGNSQTHPYVALKGRVPCMLIGPVSKGDLIVTADNEPGYAQSIGKNDAGHSVFAKSIETDLSEGKKVIEVVIL